MFLSCISEPEYICIFAMKKLLFVVIFQCVSLFANAQGHLSFKGVPIDGSLNEYVNKMKQAGFVHLGTQDGTAILSGDFAGFKNCTIGVSALKSTNLVNTIVVVFPDSDSWSTLEGSYNALKDMLTQKYGAPAEDVAEFQGYSKPRDDNDKLHELRMDRCVWYTTFRTNLGNIELSLGHQSVRSCFVRLQYWDRTNTDAVRQQAMDDL